MNVFNTGPQTVFAPIQESAVSALQDVGQSSVGALQSVSQTAVDALQDAGQNAIGGLQGAGQAVADVFQNIGQSAIGTFQDFLPKPVTENTGEVDYPEIIVNDKYAGNRYSVGGVHTAVGPPNRNQGQRRPQGWLRTLNEWAKPLFDWF